MKIMSTVFLLVLFCSCSGQNEIYSTSAGAIKGYDPVAYFTESRAIKGSKEYACKWKGVMWYFTSEENRDKFEKDPDAYAPKYGGYCAYAISQGYTAKIDPNARKIVDGSLYLNYNQGIQEKWEANQTEFIMYADSNWPKVLEN